MRSLLIVLFLALTAVPVAAQPPPAQNPLAYAQAGLWAQARVAAGQSGDPLALKLIDWYRLLTPNAATATEIATFARQNPDWPLATLLERRRQEAIVAEHDDATVAGLCTEKKPTQTSAHGAALLRCADALANLGRGKEAGALARDAWVNAISDPVTEAAFVHRFPGLISANDQWARFQRLIWDDAAGAQRQIAYLSPDRMALATERLALKTAGTGTIGRPEDDPGAMLDLARSLRRLGQDQAAATLWRSAGAAAQRAAAQTAPGHLESFWSERNQLARQLLRDGNSQDAYAVAAAHGQREPATVVEAEFLAGFIALRKLNDPKLAAAHFTALAAASPAVLTQSRAYYWLGRAAAASGGDARPDFRPRRRLADDLLRTTRGARGGRARHNAHPGIARRAGRSGRPPRHAGHDGTRAGREPTRHLAGPRAGEIVSVAHGGTLPHPRRAHRGRRPRRNDGAA